MPLTIEELRRFGSQRVALATVDGSFTGRLVPSALTDRAIVVLFEAEGGEPGPPLVIALDRILGAAAAR